MKCPGQADARGAKNGSVKLCPEEQEERVTGERFSHCQDAAFVVSH